MTPPTTPSPPSSARWFADPATRRRVIALGLFLGTFLLFSRALGFGFLDYDDPDFVTQNPHVAAGLTGSGLRWAFTSGGNAANWQPLTWLSFMLDAQLWGLDPRAFHTVNVFWHAVNAALAFYLWHRLTGLVRFSALLAAFWAWHPLRVESVAWIAGRKDVLSMFFALLALWAYAGYATAGERRSRAAIHYALALAAFALGLLCKPMLVTLPAVLLLLDLWPLHRFGAPRAHLGRLLLEKTPFAILAAASCWITYTVQHATGGIDPEFTLTVRTGNAAVSVWRYLAKLAWPFDLAACYPLHSWPAAIVLSAALGLVALTLLVLLHGRSWPWLLFGWAWFLGTLVPVLGFVQSGPQAMADRYTYLPSLGLLAGGLWAFFESPVFHRRRWIITLAAVVLVGFVAHTQSQLTVWRSSRALFEHALAVSPDNYLAQANLASTLINAGAYEAASRHARAALVLDSHYAPGHYKLGIALEKLGRPDEAMACYRTALHLRPDLALADYRLGVLLFRRGEHHEAAVHFASAVQRQPDLPDAWHGLARACASEARWPEANAAYVHALVLRPDDATLHNDFANALSDQHRFVEAADHYVRAILTAPDFGEAHYNYANLLRETNHLPQARAHYRRAIALLPRDADARFGLGVTLDLLGDATGAERAYAAALLLDPSHPDAHYNLGALQFNAGRVAEAREHFIKALRSRPDFDAARRALALIRGTDPGQPADPSPH